MKHWISALLFSQLLTSVSSQAAGLQFGIDNDVLMAADGDYTNGIFVGYSASARPLSLQEQPGFPFSNLVPVERHHDYRYNWSVQLAQKMWTPSDIRYSTPQENERPYAGLFYGNAAGMLYSGSRAYRAGVMIGVLGPASEAERAQKETHRWFNNAQPRGWDYQVENHAVVDISVDIDQLLWRSRGRATSHEFSGYGRMVAGNFRPELAAGAGWRFGTGLADSFNADTLRPYRQNPLPVDDMSGRWFLYGNLEARYRFDDLTITGDTLLEVPEVDVQHWQATGALGAVAFYDRFGLGFSLVAYRKDFEQDKKDWNLSNALTLYWVL